jgi:uncharacterized protein (TIGR00369 family)
LTEETAELAAYNELLNGGVPLHSRMGLKVLQRQPKSVLTMELNDEVRGAVEGSVHGGMLATLADVTCAISLWGSYDADTHVPVTTDMHVRYYRQPRSGPITAVGQVVHRGRRLLSAECSIVDAEDRVLARSTATYMIVPNERGR